MNKLGWLLWVACIACGDDGSSVRPDAPQASDAPTDSGADCEAAAPVTVTGPTYDPDTVTFTASLVSHDASGAMCGTKEAAAGSEASTTIDVPPGGMVTMVLVDGGDEHHLFTWTEVQPGDELVFPSLQPGGLTPKMVDVEVTVPPRAGVTTFDVYVQCEHGGGGLSQPAPAGVFTRTVECMSSATAVTAMVAAEDNGVTQYAVSEITPIAATGPTSLTLGSWTPAASPTVTVHGTAGFDRAFASYVPGPTPEYHSVSMLSFENVSSDPVTVGPRDVPSTWGNQIVVGITQTAEPAHTLQLALDQTTPMAVDLTTATDFLPLVSGELTAALPRPSITWSTDGPATADAVYLNAGTWLLVTRAEPGTVRFPEVPADLLPVEPAKVQAIVLIDAKTVAGFEDVRRTPARPYMDREYTVSTLGESIDGIVP